VTHCRTKDTWPWNYTSISTFVQIKHQVNTRLITEEVCRNVDPIVIRSPHTISRGYFQFSHFRHLWHLNVLHPRRVPITIAMSVRLSLRKKHLENRRTKSREILYGRNLWISSNIIFPLHRIVLKTVLMKTYSRYVSISVCITAVRMLNSCNAKSGASN
jgi:hypothetical protein